MDTKRVIKMGCVAMGLLLMVVVTCEVACAQQDYANGIMVEVKPGLIKFPTNIDRFPLSRAKVRSTELRELNEHYNGAVIERVYEIQKVGNRPEEKVAVEDTYIIWFADEYVNMNQALSDYSGLSEVLTVTQQ